MSEKVRDILDKMFPDAPKLYLSRRNLLTLLSKLDRRAEGAETYATIGKQDTENADYPQTVPPCMVIAVENEDYYIDRKAGEMHVLDDPDPKDMQPGGNQN